MTKSMQRRVEPSDAAEKVHKTHRNNLEAEVIKHNGGANHGARGNRFKICNGGETYR